MEPISPVYPSRATRNRWRHYERWRTPLGRFVAMADAACAYNPRFGQGMSAAAVSARLLKDCLATYGIADPRLPGRFFSVQAVPEDAVAVCCRRRLAASGHRGHARRLGAAVQLVSAEAGSLPRPAGGRAPRRGDPSREANVITVRAPGSLARPGRGDGAADQGDRPEGVFRWPSSDATGCGMISGPTLNAAFLEWCSCASDFRTNGPRDGSTRRYARCTINAASRASYRLTKVRAD